jgi:phosphatidylinositol glycan class B
VERAHLQRWALVALVLHLVAAVFTAGWLQYDEHWQILEFANTILGRASAADLPWEYAARARPSLQPWLVAGVESALLKLGVTNPFQLATAFRVLFSLFACGATIFVGSVVAAGRRWMLPALALAWFLPFLHARTSSENASEAAFLLGFGLLMQRPERDRIFLAVGACFGLAFEFRFQTGLMVGGAILWCLFIQRSSVRQLAGLALGLVALIAVGTVADHFFYGAWTFAPWNYLRVNLVEHRANSFGTSPWWAYLQWLPERLAPPVSLVLLVGCVGAWIRAPRSLLTWSMVPFFVVHCALAHKELRFLFPLATLSVVAAVEFFSALRLPRWTSFVGWALLAENLVVMAGASLLPSQPAMPIYERLYALGAKQPLQIYFLGKHPYRFSDDMYLHFYAPPDLTITPLDDYADLARHVDHGELWYLERRFEFPKEAGAVASRCTVDTTTLPRWVRRFDVGGWVGRTAAWTLYRCR